MTIQISNPNTQDFYHFIKANADLNTVLPGLIIGFQEDSDGSYWIQATFSPEFKSRDIHEAVSVIAEWKNRLLQWQGLSLRPDNRKFLMELDEKHPERSYRELAMEINHDLNERMYLYRTYLDAVQAANKNFRNTNDYAEWHTNVWFDRTLEKSEKSRRHAAETAIDRVKEILYWLIPDHECAESILQDSIDAVLDGRTPFYDEWPVDKFHVQNALEAWRDIKQKKIDQQQWNQRADEIITPIENNFNMVMPRPIGKLADIPPKEWNDQFLHSPELTQNINPFYWYRKIV